MSQNGTIKNAPQPRFPGISAPSFNFDALIDGTRSTPFVYELDLSTARDFAAGTAVQVKITGNCCLVDTAPDVGVARIIFEGTQDFTAGKVRAPIYARPGFVTRLPFWNLYIANHEQPGKLLRLIYGVDIDFQELAPALVDSRASPIDYQTTVASTTALGINGVEAIVLPAANRNGVIVWDAQSVHSCASSTPTNLIAKSSAPTGVLDGDVLQINFNIFNSINTPRPINSPILVRPGLGLYWVCGSAAQNAAMRHTVLTVL